MDVSFLLLRSIFWDRSSSKSTLKKQCSHSFFLHRSSFVLSLLDVVIFLVSLLFKDRRLTDQWCWLLVRLKCFLLNEWWKSGVLYRCRCLVSISVKEEEERQLDEHWNLLLINSTFSLTTSYRETRREKARKKEEWRLRRKNSKDLLALSRWFYSKQDHKKNKQWRVIDDF